MFHGKKCCFGLFLSVNKHPKSDSGACTVVSPQPQKEERLGKNTSTETRLIFVGKSVVMQNVLFIAVTALVRGVAVCPGAQSGLGTYHITGLSGGAHDLNAIFQ